MRDATGAGIPGVTVTATNQTTNASQTTTTGNDGSYSLSAGAGHLQRDGDAVRLPEGHADGRSRGRRRRSRSTSRWRPMLSEEITVTATKREQTLLDVPFSVAAPTEEMLRERGVEDIEGVAANVGGFTVQNLGPGQSQVAMRGVSAGQIVRDQPGVKEQVGVYLDESVISLSLFTPDLDLFDIEPRRSAARSAGDAVRLRLAVGHGPLHHQPARAGRHEGVRRARRQRRRAAAASGGNVKLGFNVPLGDKAALRVASLLQPHRRASSTPCSRTSA